MAYHSIPGTEDDENELSPHGCRRYLKMTIEAEFARINYRRHKESIDRYRKKTVERRREYARQYRQLKKQKKNSCTTLSSE